MKSMLDYQDNMDYIHALRSLINEIQQKSTGSKPKGIPVLPEQFTQEMLNSYEKAAPADLILGLEKDQITLLGIHRKESPFLIIGPVRCGKTNACHLMLNQMKGFQRIYLFESREEDCDAYKKQENVRYIDSKQKAEKSIEEIKNLIKERKEEYQDQLDDGEEIAAKQD